MQRLILDHEYLDDVFNSFVDFTFPNSIVFLPVAVPVLTEVLSVMIAVHFDDVFVFLTVVGSALAGLLHTTTLSFVLVIAAIPII